MSLKNDKKASFSLRDLKMARFLSSALHSKVEGKSKDIECPSLEDIAAYVDGNLSSKEREGILYHLNRCNDCYALFSETLETKREMEKDVMRSIGHPLWKKVIPYAIAASLVFIFIYAVYYPWMRSLYYKSADTDPLGFPRMAKRMNLLGEDMQGETSPFLFGRYQDTGYGFSGSGLSLENRLFFFGIYQTDLELSLIREDKETALTTIPAIDSLLKTIEQSDRIIEFYNDLQQKIEKNTPLSQLTGTIDKSWFDDSALIMYPRVGQWVEAGRIAALTMNGKILKVKDAGFFIDKLTHEELPQGIMNSLQTISSILEKGVLEERDYNMLEREFNNIILIHF